MKGFRVRIRKVMNLDQMNHENFLAMIVRKSLEGGWGHMKDVKGQKPLILVLCAKSGIHQWRQEKLSEFN